MKDLKSYQKMFVDEILREKNWPELRASLEPITTLNVNDILGVYRDDYEVRLSETLRDNFKSVWRVLGDSAYFEAIWEYLRGHPSSVQNLGDYGKSFPSFLQQSSYRKLFPLIGDLAQFEWDFWQVDREAWRPTPNPFAGISEKDLKEAHFQFHPSLKMYSWGMCLYNIFRSEIENCQRPQHILLFRGKGGIMVREWEHSQWEVLRLLKEGKSLKESLENSDNMESPLVWELFEFLKDSGLIISIQKKSFS